MTLHIVPAADYHADRQRVSGSLLERFLVDRRDAQAVLEGRDEQKQSDEMLLGSYTHALVLEPREVEERYAVPPRRGLDGLAPDADKPVDRRTTKGKEVWAAFLEVAQGRTIVDIPLDNRAQAMLEALRLHDEASHLLWSGGGLPERVLHWTDEHTGADCRARLDRVFEAEDVIVELKTDRDIRPFQNTNTWRWYDRGYHRKAALYIDGYTASFGRNPRLAFVFVENSVRPRVCVRWLETDSPAVEAGRVEYVEALRAFLQCRETNDWREPWEKQATTFEVPGAILRKYELGDEAPVTVGGKALF